ncbi:hypothetical protein P7C73_g6315, partial [Tremellales sp. Uapishka_1]
MPMPSICPPADVSLTPSLQTSSLPPASSHTIPNQTNAQTSSPVRAIRDQPVMSGAAQFETQQTPLARQERMTDCWSTVGSSMSGGRSQKDLHHDPSPTFSASPYPQAAGYHIPYPTLSGAHFQQRFPQYYPEYEAGTSYRQSDPFTHQQMSFEGTQPLLTTTSLARSFDAGAGSYYPINGEAKSWESTVTPDKREVAGQKRKREKNVKPTPPSSDKSVKTPKKGKPAAERASKRVKVEDQSRRDSISPVPQTQLPTPPSTGKELSGASLPNHLRIPAEASLEKQPFEDSQEDAERKPSLLVARVEGQGRNIILNVNDQVVSIEQPDSSVAGKKIPRTTTLPALTIADNGMALFATEEVLESEMAWLENGARSPPSSPDLVMQTPTMTHDVVEDLDTPPQDKEERLSKRFAAFDEDIPTAMETMVSTRVEQFGRVAVRKDTALRFLGLETNAPVMEEETHQDDVPIAGSSKLVKPVWPDDMAPWSFAGGVRKERARREEKERASMLKRYLETSSDESSDEEFVITMTIGKGKGKNALRMLPEEAQTRPRYGRNMDSLDADAKTALLVGIRNRPLPVIQPGVVACICGASNAAGMGSMIPCASCRTWHHIACCGFEDDSQIGPQWMCSACQSQAIAMSTPARSTPRPMYAQSDERSAFKGELLNVALAPSPMFAGSAMAANTRTPLHRAVQSPGRPHRSRILSYGTTDMWSYTEDTAPPSTPIPSRTLSDRFSTPRIDDAPFDVTSTPSRHIDFNFGQPSLFSLTPLGGRTRMPSAMFDGMTPLQRRNPSVNQAFSESIIPSRHGHDFFRELNRGANPIAPYTTDLQASPRRSLGLLGAHPVSPSPFIAGHRRNLSANKLSSMRSSSSRSGLGLGAAIEED